MVMPRMMEMLIMMVMHFSTQFNATDLNVMPLKWKDDANMMQRMTKL